MVRYHHLMVRHHHLMVGHHHLMVGHHHMMVRHRQMVVRHAARLGGRRHDPVHLHLEQERLGELQVVVAFQALEGVLGRFVGLEQG